MGYRKNTSGLIHRILCSKTSITPVHSQ